jgi:hypothetical protein
VFHQQDGRPRPLPKESFTMTHANRLESWIVLLSLALTTTAVVAQQAGRSNDRRDAPMRADSAKTWAFEPGRDDFGDEALLDLRYLNEKVAGEHGFIGAGKDGSGFVRGDGQPIRFWAVNTGAYRKHPKKPAPDLDRHGRFLAKRGVNMVRFHGNITPAGDDLEAIDEKQRDDLWRLVGAMRKHGIYTTFSPYWANSSRVKPAMGTLDAGKAHNHGLLFFDKKLQGAYKSWLRQVLTVKNPHTGIPLAQDPALAIIQIQNEDSLLFWTSQNIEGEAAAELRRQFATFAAGKYGSLDKARQAWGNDKHKHDDFAKNQAGLYIIWFLTQKPRNAGQGQRWADQMEFFTTTMRRFNAEMASFLRDELGCKQLINAGNWRTADDARMLDAERYSYGANEVLAVNRYTSGRHEGKHTGWAIVAGDRFTDESILTRPRQFALNIRQPAGHTFIVPEGNWVPPLSRQSEGPLLIAAYQGLTGVDGYYWFATGEEGWRQPASANGYLPSVGKWVFATPMVLGQFPAAALMHRMGYVKQAAPAVVEKRPLSALWRREAPAVPESPSYDPNRDASRPVEGERGSIDPLAFLAGPVVVEFVDDEAKAKVTTARGLDECIDRDAGTVRSLTGELLWDYANGVARLDAPKAQGVTGRLKSAGGTFKLSDVTIDSKDEYATIVVVAMDDRPLAQSTRVLVQVGTVARPTGWRTRPARLGEGDDAVDGEEIASFGKAPWQITATAATLTINNAKLRRAVALDPNGMPLRELTLKAAPGAVSLALPPDALYVVLTDEAK